MNLLKQEIEFLEKKIKRTPSPTELDIVSAEWSEHCSYKSSKIHLKMLPKKGRHVVTGKRYDSGVLDVGDGYVVTVHIESHNHPSAVEPYGGAATGVGGVIRDILSAGTRPIAIFDGLRFGNIEKDKQARWLFKNAVVGIADYGNCLGIPTIGGEVEFDDSYTNYALVDVLSVGLGKKEKLIENHAQVGDVVVLIGGSTGRDGIGGSQFASDSLESEDRSAVQIPDPFIEKLIIEALLEARDQNLIHAMKDLGGGGLSCAISETADALSIGIDLDVSKVHVREKDMRPNEIMTSESQERMLIITSKNKLNKLKRICKKFHLGYSVIGTVTSDKKMLVRKGKQVFADLPTHLVANAPLLNRPSRKPSYLSKIKNDNVIKEPKNISEILLRLLCSPNIASKNWVYGQFDHEVGIRTVIKPGSDASVLRLDNGKFLAIKIDGNPKQCFLNPRQGAMGCFEEACRNVVCTGAKPIGMVDHLQFGNPEDPEIFWTFLESLKGITEFAQHFKIPCVGGKVSFYNETPDGPIKPTPLIGVLGLSKKLFVPKSVGEGDLLFIVGKTSNEMGGSEYYECIHNFVGGTCPQIDLDLSKQTMDTVLGLINNNMTLNVHDCSKGGLAIASAELCINNNVGCQIDLDEVPGDSLSSDRAMFSESHSRYLVAIKKGLEDRVRRYLSDRNTPFGVIGIFGGESISFDHNSDRVANLRVDKAQNCWLNSLKEILSHG